MTYKDALTVAMNDLAKDPDVVFIGYGVKYGKAGGTLKYVPENQLIETPVAENLMVGLATGMALMGKKPVVFIERFDFIMNAMDAIVNHLDKIQKMSNGEFNPCIILRVVIGNSTKPLFTGATHTQDFTEALKRLVSFPVHRLDRAEEIELAYKSAKAGLDLPPKHSTMLIERKDQW